jgi:hypothetical protein
MNSDRRCVAVSMKWPFLAGISPKSGDINLEKSLFFGSKSIYNFGYNLFACTGKSRYIILTATYLLVRENE